MQSSVSMTTLESGGTRVANEGRRREGEECWEGELQLTPSYEISFFSSRHHQPLETQLLSSLFSVSFFLLGFLCCVMRIFVHSLHGLPPKRTHSQSSYVSGTTERKKKLSWAAHKSQDLSESAKRFCLTLHLTRGRRRGWRRGKWPKVGRKEDLQCPLAAVPGMKAGRQVAEDVYDKELRS